MDVVRILLIGKTGSGKSSTGNTLLKKQVFEVAMSASSITDQCRQGSTYLREYEVALEVVDTPGSFDTRADDTDLRLDVLTETTALLAPGFHVILLTIKPDRHTKEDIKSLNAYLDFFGEKIFDHLVIVTTKLDELRKNKMTLDKYIATLPKDSNLVEAYNKCGRMAISIDNKASGMEMKEKHAELMKTIHEVIRKNNGKYFNHDCFKQAHLKLLSRKSELRGSEKTAQVAQAKKKVEKLRDKYPEETFRKIEKAIDNRTKLDPQSGKRSRPTDSEELEIDHSKVGLSKTLSDSAIKIVNEAVDDLDDFDKAIAEKVKQEIENHGTIFKQLRETILDFFRKLMRRKVHPQKKKTQQ